MKLFQKLISSVTAAAIAIGGTAAVGVGTATSLTADAASMSATELVADMGMGWNVGNSLDGTNTWTTWTDTLTPNDVETAWGNVATTEAMILDIKAAGFNTIRIPVTWWDMTGKSVTASDMYSFDGNVADAFLARVKEVVDYAINNGMYAIIDTHHDENWEVDTSKIGVFETLWKQIATYFKDYDEHLVFEGMNEVAFSSVTDAMNYNQVFVDTVRATGGNNTDRLLIVTAQDNNTYYALDNSFSMPDDSSNMLAVSVHYYEPSAFCLSDDPTNQWWYSSTFGTTSEINTVYNDMNDLKTKFVDNGYGVVIGEFGVVNTDGNNNITTAYKDTDSIYTYYETVLDAANSIDGICPIVWDDSDCGSILLYSRKNMKWWDSNMEAIFLAASQGTSSGSVSSGDSSGSTGDTGSTGNTGSSSGNTGSSTATGEQIGEAYFIGMIGAEQNWDAGDNDGALVTPIYGDGTYTITWNVSGGTDKLEFLSGVIAPYGEAQTFTTDTFEDLTVTIDGVTIDGSAVSNYSQSANAVNTRYYESEGVTRMYLCDTWTGTKVEDLSTSTTITKQITMTFTISGTGIDGGTSSSGDTGSSSGDTGSSSGDTGSSSGNTGSSTATGEQIGEAYFIGMIGAEQNWDAGDNDGALVTPIYGDGTYTITWNVSGGTDKLEFLSGVIAPYGEAQTFTTDTFENLTVTIDGVTIDGSAVSNYSQSANAVNTRYYESEGVTRMYLCDTWTGTKVEDLSTSTTITKQITMTFTISGTGVDGGTSSSGDTGNTGSSSGDDTSGNTPAEPSTEPSIDPNFGVEDDDTSALVTLYGDVVEDGALNMADVIYLAKMASGTVTSTDVQAANGDVNGNGTIDSNDAVVLLQFELGMISTLPYAG